MNNLSTHNTCERDYIDVCVCVCSVYTYINYTMARPYVHTNTHPVVQFIDQPKFRVVVMSLCIVVVVFKSLIYLIWIQKKKTIYPLGIYLYAYVCNIITWNNIALPKSTFHRQFQPTPAIWYSTLKFKYNTHKQRKIENRQYFKWLRESWFY